MAGIRSWSRLGLQAKIFSFFTLIVVGLVGLLLFFSYQQANQLAETTLDEALRSTRILYENFQGERLEKLSLVNSVVAESPIFRAIVADEEAAYDGVTLLDAAQEMVQGVGRAISSSSRTTRDSCSLAPICLGVAASLSNNGPLSRRPWKVRASPASGLKASASITRSPFP